MAFNNWPYTNFQDLNLGWILNKVKEALTKAAEALTSTTGFDDRITTAETNSSEANTKATEALATANTANGKATEALSTANNASDTANTASTNATQARTDATQARADATRALDEVGGAIGSYKIFVNAQNQCSHAGESIDAVDVVSALTDGIDIFVERADSNNLYFHTGYKFAYYDVDNSTTPATTTVFFDRLISYAGENAVVERMSMINGSNTASFLTIQTLASKSYVDSHSGGGGTSIQDIIDTVNDGDTNALLSTVQTLSAAQQAQVKQNLGISGGGGSYSPYLIPVTQIGSSYSTTATGYDVFDHILDCRIIFNGVYYYQIGSTLSGAFGDAYFACTNPSASGTIENDIFAVRLRGNDTCTIAKYERDVSLLPVMSSADTGKFARVNSSGVWVAETVPSAESNSFGGA